MSLLRRESKPTQSGRVVTKGTGLKRNRRNVFKNVPSRLAKIHSGAGEPRLSPPTAVKDDAKMENQKGGKPNPTRQPSSDGRGLLPSVKMHSEQSSLSLCFPSLLEKRLCFPPRRRERESCASQKSSQPIEGRRETGSKQRCVWVQRGQVAHTRIGPCPGKDGDGCPLHCHFGIPKKSCV